MEASPLPLNVVTGSSPTVVDELLKLGGDHLRNCYQCGTCSVVCPRTPLDGAFPRKEMVWSQWGLEDKLVGDADAWLCYQCNECNIHCPVDAKPGDLMAALRSYQIQSYAFPHFMAKLNRGARYLLQALAVPAFFVGLLLFLAIVVGDGEFIPDGPVLYEHMIGHVWIDTVTLGMLAVVFAFAGVGARRFWRSINEAGPHVEHRRGFWPSFWSAIGDVLTHRDFKDCKENHNRAYAHMAIFYGFLLLVAATVGAFFYTVVFKWVGIDWQDNELSLPLWDPVKIVGNLGFVLLLGGGIWVTVRHFTHPEQAGEHSYPDWLFIGIVYAAALTGFGLMVLRLAEVPEVAYPFYVVHLLFVYSLFVYFPYSKFAHVIYRILANTHAKMLGRRAGAYTGHAEIV